jgi:hypothetical protein
MVAGCFVGFALLATAVEVEGSTACPSPAQVSERLVPLLSTDATDGEGSHARLWQQGDEVAVELDAPDGSTIGTRRFSTTYSCADLASAIAVALATWASDVHPAFAPHLEAARPSPTIATTAADVRVPAAPAPAAVNVAAGLGGGVASAGSGSGFAAEAVVGAWLLPTGWRLWPRLELDLQSERRLSLSEGAVAWRRFSLGLGVEANLVGDREARVRLNAFALARLAWLDLHGQGFNLNRGDAVLDPGATAGVRAVLGRGRWQPWVELAASVWLARHDLEATGLGMLGHLPRGELFARLGVSVVWLR